MPMTRSYQRSYQAPYAPAYRGTMASGVTIQRAAVVVCFVGAGLYALFFLIVLVSKFRTMGVLPVEALGFFGCGGAAMYLGARRIADRRVPGRR